MRNIEIISLHKVIVLMLPLLITFPENTTLVLFTMITNIMKKIWHFLLLLSFQCLCSLSKWGGGTLLLLQRCQRMPSGMKII